MAGFRLIPIWLSLALIGYAAVTLSDVRAKNTSTKHPFGFTYSKSLIAENGVLFKTVSPQHLEQISLNSYDILTSAPLNADALLHSAIVEQLRSQAPINTAILEKAKNRNPRRTAILLYMLDAAQQSGDIAGILAPLDLLFRLKPSDHTTYYAVLSGLYENPISRPQIQDAVKRNPIWAYNFLLQKIQTTPESGLDNLNPLLQGYINQGFDVENDRRLIQNYLSRLIAQNRFTDAYTFWKDTLPSAYKINQAYPGLFNGRFEKRAVAPPFNWRLINTPDVVSEFNIGGGLYISFNGGNPTVVARQSLLWPAGHEGQLTINGRYQAKRKQGRFDIRFQCQQTQEISANILLSDLGDLSDSPVVTIPPIEDGCEMSEILIIGRPDIFAERISLSLNSLDLSFRPHSQVPDMSEGK